jgi:hypothetical protein
MNFYLTDAQIPELTGLTKKKRRLVRRGALEIFRSEKPLSFIMTTMLPIGIFTFVGCFTGAHLSHSVSTNYRLLMMMAVALIISCFGSFIVHYCFNVRLRPYFSRYIELNRSDLSKAA